MCIRFIIALVVLSVAAEEDPKSQVETVKTGDFAFPDDLSIRTKQNLRGHHHHHHHHDFPIFYHPPPSYEVPLDVDDSDEAPKEIGIKEVQSPNASLQIPVDFIQKLNGYTLNDLLLNFVEGEENDEESFPVVQNRFGGDGEERSAAIRPKGAECKPETKTVELAENSDPSILYIPQCTRVERCGGCCKHELLSCQALEKENISYKVYKTKYTGDNKLKFLGTDVITVEQHTKCKCMCKVRPENCTVYQEYREAECACACKNHDEMKKCAKYYETKLWNPKLCTCQCRNITQCSTGSYFDQNQCKCMLSPTRSGNLQRKSFTSDPFEIMGLDENY